ncbi:hypothetical protein NQD34_003497 [Periophthalmus magnuspinnatus]|nr:hypothetical protein NQD34_003497 [Periophthalmus magnuspinnatus]
MPEKYCSTTRRSKSYSSSSSSSCNSHSSSSSSKSSNSSSSSSSSCSRCSCCHSRSTLACVFSQQKYSGLCTFTYTSDHGLNTAGLRFTWCIVGHRGFELKYFC